MREGCLFSIILLHFYSVGFYSEPVKRRQKINEPITFGDEDSCWLIDYKLAAGSFLSGIALDGVGTLKMRDKTV